MDIEERYRELLRTVVDHAPIVLFALDTQGRFTLSQGRGLKALGLEPGQVVGMSALDLYRDTAWIVDAIHRALAGEALTASGEVGGRWYETRCSPLHDAAGGTIGTIGVATDVTERCVADLERAKLLNRERAARGEAEDAHRRAAFLAEASRLLARSLDLDVTLATVARLAVPELADWCVVDLLEDGAVRRVAVVHPDPAKAELARDLQERTPSLAAPEGIPRALRSRHPVAYDEVSFSEGSPGLTFGTRDPAHLDLIRRLGVECYVVTPLVGRDRTLGALTFVRSTKKPYTGGEIELVEDLARRAALAVDNARLYDEAQAAIRARQEFLSVASHELKTPMTALHLSVQTLRRAVEGMPEEQSRSLGSIAKTADRQARRISTLLETLLDLTRVETGRLELALGPSELGEIVRDVAAGLEEECRRSGCAVEIRAGGPAHGRWDRSRLEQVVTNLLANAMKYGAGRPIEIDVALDGGAATLAVTDHGIGIEPGRQATIFRRFERAVSVRSYGGLGLGLYIVRRIVEAHGGQVGVRSAPGQGATFTLRLPLEPDPK